MPLIPCGRHLVVVGNGEFGTEAMVPSFLLRDETETTTSCIMTKAEDESPSEYVREL